MLYCSVFFLWAVILIFLLLAKRLAGKSIYNMTCLVSSETLKLNQSTSGLYRFCFQFSFYYLIVLGTVW